MQTRDVRPACLSSAQDTRASLRSFSARKVAFYGARMGWPVSIIGLLTRACTKPPLLSQSQLAEIYHFRRDFPVRRSKNNGSISLIMIRAGFYRRNGVNQSTAVRCDTNEANRRRHFFRFPQRFSRKRINCN